MTLSIVILAAGKSTRMHSALPKVLHPLAGKPLLEHIAYTVAQLNPSQPPIVIYGYQGDTIRQKLAHLNVTWVEQSEQLGTGHALSQALPHIPQHNQVLVLYGDVPLISKDTLQKFIASTPIDTVGIITATIPHPTGFGRIIRDNQHKITAIIEEKDADKTQRDIREINTGIYLIPAKKLKEWLPHLQNNNTQKEYYLTDVIKMAAQHAIPIHDIQTPSLAEILGINDRVQLAHLERYYQRHVADQLMRQGVTLMDPNRFDVRGDLTVGLDVVIDINVIIEGKVVIGKNCTIGANTILRNVMISDNVEIKANSVIDGAEIAANCIIGPFARIRPGTILSAHSHIGNFVEIKNSTIGESSKINHLSYIGDSSVGKHVNIGAGTITCNYDGINKHRTTIEDNVFIGSNSQLIAPVTIGEGATIGAGSTITRHAPPHQLTLARATQRSIENWQKPTRKKES